MIVGTVAEGAVRLLAPVVATWALGWGMQDGVRKAWHAATGAPTTLTSW